MNKIRNLFSGPKKDKAESSDGYTALGATDEKTPQEGVSGDQQCTKSYKRVQLQSTGKESKESENETKEKDSGGANGGKYAMLKN